MTTAQRLLAMACDWATARIIGLGLAFTYTAIFAATGPLSATDRAVQTLLVTVVPALALPAVMLTTHRSPGEAAVRLRPRGDRRQVDPPTTVVRWLLGIGGYLLLSAGPGWLATTLALASVVAVLLTRGHRGLAYRVVGWALTDDRENHPAPSPRAVGAEMTRRQRGR